ncbi:hypothetical protein L687_08720 [Microbacterium maritypicum MF109]|uniref:Uncharacterized protein n=1 Tax=Microbacterium maritypicum MF109 TaxID=1333857 RepID=T5KA94_MICMQ|nr:hypothetical protein L687_08720 [Microbacterium maritypicum MF109]
MADSVTDHGFRHAARYQIGNVRAPEIGEVNVNPRRGAVLRPPMLN